MIKLFYPQSARCSPNHHGRSRVLVTYDESSDSSDGGDGLARAVVQLDLDEVLLGLPCLSSSLQSPNPGRHTCVKLTAKWPSDLLNLPYPRECGFVGLGAVCLLGDLWHEMSVVGLKIEQNSLQLTLNDHIAGLDGDLDPLGDFEQFLGMAARNCQLWPVFDICACVFPRGLEWIPGPASRGLQAQFAGGACVSRGRRTCTSS
jgi:hypothetical protein